MDLLFVRIRPFLDRVPLFSRVLGLRPKTENYASVKAAGFSSDKEVPPPHFVGKCHRLEPQVTAEVDGYFVQNWPFPNQKAVQKFRDAGFSRVTCCYYPEALDDRIHFACRLLTLLFLIDGAFPRQSHHHKPTAS